MRFNHSINLLEKRIRAEVIKDYLCEAGIEEVVCYTCGNSSKYLKLCGVKVEEVKEADRWYKFGEIAGKHKKFDATSGHLPLPLMVEIANRLRLNINVSNNKIILQNEELSYDEVLYLPSGSGETMFCMKLAFPELNIQPVYNIDYTTEWSDEAPLNGIIKIISYEKR